MVSFRSYEKIFLKCIKLSIPKISWTIISANTKKDNINEMSLNPNSMNFIFFSPNLIKKTGILKNKNNISCFVIRNFGINNEKQKVKKRNICVFLIFRFFLLIIKKYGIIKEGFILKCSAILIQYS